MIRARHSRKAVGDAQVLVVDSLVVDVARGRAERDGRPLRLPPRQFELLAHLARHAGAVVSRDALAKHVWEDDTATWTNVITVSVHCLRRELEQAGCPTILHTVRGRGYRLGEPADSGQ